MMAGQTKFFTFVTMCNNYRSLFVNRPPINYTQVSTLRQASKEKLKSLPERPKKPSSAFFLYGQQRRNELMKIHPNAKVTELAKILSNEWSNIDAGVKQKYELEYKNAMEEYLKKYLNYNVDLTDEQKIIIKEVEDEKAREKKNRKARKVLKDLKKPKRPKGPFINFVVDYYGKDKEKFNSYMDFLRQSKAIWDKLSVTEREKYNDMYLDDKKRYELEMELWEAQMIREGRTDLVRQQTLIYTTKPRRTIKAKSRDPNQGDIKHKPAKTDSNQRKHLKHDSTTSTNKSKKSSDTPQ